MTTEDFQKELDDRNAASTNEKTQADQIHAVNKAGIKTVQAVNSLKDGLHDVKGNVTVTNPDLAKSSDLQNVTDSINKMNMTAFMTNDGLPKLAQNLTVLTDAVDGLSKKYQNEGLSELSQQLKKTVDQLGVVAKNLTQTKIKVDLPLQKTIDGLTNSIKAIDFKPTVNVPPATVKVSSPKVDTSGLESVMQQYLSDENKEIDLDDYRAQDLDEMELGVQYVGFVNPKGAWYIVKNVEENNTLRYAFGNDSYSAFWPQASKLDYTLLNEALHEVQT